LQAVIEETVVVLELKVGKKSGSGTKNKIDFLKDHGLLTSEEQSAYSSASWGFLSSGNHPGLSSEDEGRIGTIIFLEFIQTAFAQRAKYAAEVECDFGITPLLYYNS
jgi:hypothetical protein